ncbi:amino acid ABC transporter permease [Actinomadura rayongensis]|uniref:ABC transporter permease subunit n=1 Tax=Actinomadura rayongensis TaxID=1429076 RepID=A0A6I4WJH4_9ACTN|nr:amino acid ABC transporter permease [Actinomadura rayongensis]MXQ67846.1 ABC transporter permease subunit [Actinomadura rayongensis]
MTDIRSSAVTAAPPAAGGVPRRLPRRHPFRWLALAVILVLAAMFAHGLVTNPNLQWDVVRHYFTSADVLRGLRVTIELTAGTMIISIVLGTAVAALQMSGGPLLAGVAGVYVWVLRSVPLLVQLLFWFNISALYPRLSLGVPFGPEFVSGNVNAFMTPWVAALVGLGLEGSAFVAETVRAGIRSVEPGQTEAARALGLRGPAIFRWIVLPQAIPVIIPSLANILVITLKATALVSVISLSDLLYTVETIYGRTYQPIPLLLTATIWYLILTLLLTLLQRGLERRFGRSARRGAPAPLWRDALAGLGSGLARFVVPSNRRAAR